MFWILLLVLTVVGGAATVGMVATARRRQLGGGSPATAPKALPGGDALVERGVRNLRVGDVVTLDGRDFLCEGTVGYDEAGHRWVGARIVDGTDVRWIVAGLERTGGDTVRLLTVETSRDLAGHPAETIVLGDVRYTQERRGTATCKLAGDLGGLGGSQADRPAEHVERCRWWAYGAPGDATLIVEQWGGDYRALRGEKVAAATLDVIPGS